jgi:hypothetical protein
MGTCYWDKKYGKKSTCPITHSRLRPGKNKDGISYIITIDCNHTFYRKALIEWYKVNKTCPVCRTKFKLVLNKD